LVLGALKGEREEGERDASSEFIKEKGRNIEIDAR